MAPAEPTVVAANAHDDEVGKLAGLQAGRTTHKEHWGEVHVSNDAGKARSHIHLTSEWDVPPQTVFSIFTYPDNSKVFRDMQRVGSRKVLVSKPNYKEVEVEQTGELKVLWIRRTFSTWLKVVEDSRDAECLTTEFTLLRSDVLAQFHGRWELRPIKDESGAVIGTASELHQDVLPHGIPSFLRNLPVMGDLLRAVTMRAIRRLMEDVMACIRKIKAGEAQGKSVMDVMRELCGKCDEEGHANGAVASFAVDDGDEEEDSSEEGEASSEAARLAAALAERLVAVEMWAAEGEQRRR